MSALGMTGHSDEILKETAIRSGAMEFVSEPFRVSDFLTKLQRMFLTRKLAWGESDIGNRPENLWKAVHSVDSRVLSNANKRAPCDPFFLFEINELEKEQFFFQVGTEFA